MRRRDGTPVVAVNEADGAIHIYKLRLIPTAPYVDPLTRLERERSEIFSALAPIVGHDGLADLFANFDAALAALKQEREAL